MEGPTIEGHPIPILVSEEQHVFSLDEEALEKVLLQDHIKDCNAVVVSVAGAFRKGKSFLLDFFLRYMNYMVCIHLVIRQENFRLINKISYHKYKHNEICAYVQYISSRKQNPGTSWLGDENSPLNGFSWRGGSERDTTGILMWSEVFCTTLPNGEKVRVVHN